MIVHRSAHAGSRSCSPAVTAERLARTMSSRLSESLSCFDCYLFCDRMFTCSFFSFPASSPFVTAVGGTLLNDVNEPETGIDFSGGGFSNVFAQPSYQSSAVASFLSSSQNLPSPSYYNKTSRAYPDVSAAAANFIVVVNKEESKSLSDGLMMWCNSDSP